MLEMKKDKKTKTQLPREVTDSCFVSSALMSRGHWIETLFEGNWCLFSAPKFNVMQFSGCRGRRRPLALGWSCASHTTFYSHSNAV